MKTQIEHAKAKPQKNKCQLNTIIWETKEIKSVNLLQSISINCMQDANSHYAVSMDFETFLKKFLLFFIKIHITLYYIVKMVENLNIILI